jgi:branched-chain amino acid transport system substrate-binding protein
MRTFTLSRRAVALGLLSPMLPAVVSAPGHAQGQGPIKIGMQAGITGPAAADGNAAVAAVKIAFDRANAAGGVNGRPLELVVEDDQGKPDQAVPLANRMIGDKVVAVISAGFSAPSRTAAPVFQKAKIPYIAAIAFAPEITKVGDYMFRVTSVGEVQGRAGAMIVGKILGKKKAVVLTIKTDFGKTLVAGFKEAAPKFGVEIVKEYEYGPGDRQFGPMIAGIKADNPDVIYATGFYFTGGPLVNQIRAAGITVPIVGPESFSSQKFIEIAGQAAEGTIITNVIDWGTTKTEVREFLTEFEKRTGGKAEAVAAQAYAAATVLIEALKAAKSTDPEKIREALEKTDVDTTIGHLSFNKLHEVRKPFPYSIVRNGAWQADGVVDDMVLLAPPE